LSQIPIGPPALGQALFKLSDHAKRYYADKAMVAFEMHECHRTGAKDFRTVFPQIWKNILWSIWWWANSEDKARMKIERWKAGPTYF
jgi:hypothetical protein